MQYVLVAAPGGSGLKQSVERLRAVLLEHEYQVGHADVEDVLCESYEVSELLKGVPVEGKPNMGDVTGYLPRTQIVPLWRKALRQSLNRLRLDELDQSAEREGSGRVNLLSCHLDLYGGRWKELYSPLDIPSLFNSGHKCSHVVLFIDDIYDMYWRLSRPKYLYDDEAMIATITREVERGSAAGKRKRRRHASAKSVALKALERRIDSLSALMAWRRAEMLMAEALARQLGARYLVFGVKHRTEALARWLTHEESASAYVSHPITRPREQRKETGEWPPDVVTQCNGLPSKLAEWVTCVMPTAIDELRIAKDDRGHLPQLEARWPIPTERGLSDTLYYLPLEAARVAESDADAHHAELLVSGVDEPPREEGEPNLRRLESLIEQEISFRDHHLVTSAGSLLVFRPYYDTGRVSRGVAAEADHWRLLAEAEDGGGIVAANPNLNRRSAFIHFAEDVRSLLAELAKTAGGGATPVASGTVVARLVDLLAQRGYGRSGMAQRLVRKLMEDTSFESLLDTGVVPAHLVSQLRSDWPALTRQARLDVLEQELTLTEMPAGRAAIWILEDKEHLGSELRSVGEFLSGSGSAPTEWEERGHDLWTQHGAFI